MPLYYALHAGVHVPFLISFSGLRACSLSKHKKKTMAAEWDPGYLNMDNSRAHSSTVNCHNCVDIGLILCWYWVNQLYSLERMRYMEHSTSTYNATISPINWFDLLGTFVIKMSTTFLDACMRGTCYKWKHSDAPPATWGTAGSSWCYVLKAFRVPSTLKLDGKFMITLFEIDRRILDAKSFSKKTLNNFYFPHFSRSCNALIPSWSLIVWNESPFLTSQRSLLPIDVGTHCPCSTRDWK
jgi:hypothetical protein